MDDPFEYLQELEGVASRLTTFAAFFALGMIVLGFVLPRRYAIIPLLVTCCYMTLGQRLIILDLNFTLFRILLFAGWLRILVRHEYEGLKLTSLDRLFIWWVFASLLVGILLRPTMDGLQNRVGFAYNGLGTYFLVRCLIRNFDDFQILLRALAVICIPLALSMIVEKFTQRNAFAVFGGVPPITFEREGRLRCQGPFAHPILAGTLGACVFPLLASYYRQLAGKRSSRSLILGGLVCSGVIVVASASSGPLMAAGAGMVALLLWSRRFGMRRVRWGIVLVLVALQVFMKVPIWFLIAKVSVFSGGTGYHRSYLIDQCVRNFSDWWLLGTNYTADWGPVGPLPWDHDNTDITCQYVLEGVNGGLLKLALFIAIIISAYAGIGRAMHRLEKTDLARQFMLWGLGCSLTAHVVSFLSVAYFDQLIVFYYLTLALASALALCVQEPEPVAVAPDPVDPLLVLSPPPALPPLGASRP